jgi:hypothetical protein
MMRRSALVVFAVALMGSIGFGAQRSAAPAVDVYKTPTCGCCSKWVELLRADGFTIRVKDLADLSQIKSSHRIPPQLQSCHTATVGAYVVEGHVPVKEIRRLLKERPAVAGIAVAGMPMGSPGMEVGDVKQPYNVMAFDKQGQSRVFASYGK